MSKVAGKRRSTPARRKRPSAADEPPGDGGPDETARFIAESVIGLARLAQCHDLSHLRYLLELVRLEAEEHVRLRSRGRLS